MESNKSNKFWIIIVIVLVVAIGIILALEFKNKDVNKESGNMEPVKTENIEKKVNIVKSEAKQLELEEYKTDVFTMKKPKGWKVETGGEGIFYTIRAYDPQNTNNQVYLMLKVQPLLKSEASKKFWQNYYNMSGNNSQYKLFADAVILENPTTEGYYSKFNEISSYVKSIDPSFSTINFPTFSDFKKIEDFESNASMKNVAVDSKVLRATFKGDNSKDGEGMFMASVVNFGNQYTGSVDILYYMVYDIMAISADKDEFINYKDILLQSANSIEFTDSYVKKTIDDGNAQTKQALALNASIQKAFDSYMSAWENRQKSYDIMSQKQSDATLGYERVYDTETGDIYKAYNGFTDDYYGNRYQGITDDMYSEAVSGYIELVQ